MEGGNKERGGKTEVLHYFSAVLQREVFLPRVKSPAHNNMHSPPRGKCGFPHTRSFDNNRFPVVVQHDLHRFVLLFLP